MKVFRLLIVLFLFFSSCKEEKKVNEQIDNGLIKNSNFENNDTSSNPAFWQSEFDSEAAKIESSGYLSGHALLQKSSSSYKVYTYQKTSGLSNGYYKLTAWVQNSGGQNACYINAKDYGGVERMTSIPVSQSGWTQVIIRGIEVTNSSLTVGLYSDAKGGNWCKIDNWDLVKDDIAYNFLKGGDVSELSYLEAKGAKFYDNGAQEDCFQILKKHGFNIVRLRLYNDPGNPDYSPSNRLPKGFQGPDDILSLSARAKAAGMKILLTFHYSDYWTNGITQNKPHEWNSLNYTELKKAMYDFTYDFMSKMKAQNTTPEYVSLGNETAGGFLFPDGDYNHFGQMAELFNEGYDAVKAVSSDSKVIIHLDDAGNLSKYTWFFQTLSTNGGKYDIIGASYYPFWTKKTVEEIRTWAESTTATLGKKILVMETGYNWNPVLPSGKSGQLADNGSYNNVYPSTPAGQRDFLYDCFNGLKLVKAGDVLGDIYWDPIMISVPGVGWELGAPNVVSNTTLFDFNGNSLTSFNAFEFNN